MKRWNLGARVLHETFGRGTVLHADDHHITVHFDDRGRRTLSTRHVTLTDAGEPPTPVESLPQMPTSPHTTPERNTTDVGFENRNGQKVVRPTMLRGDLPGQFVYVLQCGNCHHQYGTNGCDIDVRRCPACDGGPPGLAFSS